MSETFQKQLKVLLRRLLMIQLLRIVSKLLIETFSGRYRRREAFI